MREITMLVYPWDFTIDGVEAVVDTAADLGVTRLQVAAAYHSAEIITPRRMTTVSMSVEANAAHFPLPARTFSDLALPSSSIANNHPALYPELREEAQRAGLAVDGWVVAFHNSDLAQRRPDTALRNCFGDPFTHGLCPSNPAAREYAKELFGSIAASGHFNRLLAESVSFLLCGHGHPHELRGIRLDQTTRFLLSLCFCESCITAARERDIDAESMMRNVASELHRTWNGPLAAMRTADEGPELASLLMNWPSLAAYVRMRLDTVSSLVEELVAVCHGQSVAFDMSAAVWARPAPLNWMEGIDILRVMQTADRFVVESYFESVGDVARELDHVLALAASSSTPPTADLGVALTLWPEHHASRDVFLSKVRAARTAGARSLVLYNYATAPAETLGWVRDAAHEFGGTH